MFFISFRMAQNEEEIHDLILVSIRMITPTRLRYYNILRAYYSSSGRHFIFCYHDAYSPPLSVLRENSQFCRSLFFHCFFLSSSFILDLHLFPGKLTTVPTRFFFYCVIWYTKNQNLARSEKNWI